MNGSEYVPQIFTADAVGEPGQRIFYLQVRGDFGMQTYLLEKAQVSLLAEKMREILVMIDATDTIAASEPARDPALALSEPLEPEWRIGTMGLAYDEESDLIVLFVSPVSEDEEQPTEELDLESSAVRFMLRRDQVRGFVLHALAVVGEGRPTCQLCGLPVDPEGHDCPARNGHRGSA
jgi:uncharacterized repeat protein (TIGR03847 family)